MLQIPGVIHFISGSWIYKCCDFTSYLPLILLYLITPKFNFLTLQEMNQMSTTLIVHGTEDLPCTLLQVLIVKSSKG